ncbi:MAG: OB-fold domain-containing protein [Actinomycetota bacterium]|nr:OB-fold domain-containing protein [Actinomycetota bacterium]
MTETVAYPPQPAPDADTAEFWQATAEGRLAMCRCQQCGLWHMPPLERCRVCAGPTSFEEVAGTGTLYSFIVQHHPAISGYTEDLPYAVGLVELDEQPGLRLPTRIVGIDPSAIACDMRLQVVFEKLPGGDYVVPVFAPESIA